MPARKTIGAAGVGRCYQSESRVADRPCSIRTDGDGAFEKRWRAMHRQRRPASGKVGGDILVSKLTCRRCHKIAEASDGRLPDRWWYTKLDTELSVVSLYDLHSSMSEGVKIQRRVPGEGRVSGQE